MKLVVSDPKSGKAYQVENDTPTLVGMKIGDTFDGSVIGLTGYSLVITGGSDSEGFPMRKDLPGTGRKRLYLSGGTGYHPKEKGTRKRKSVRGRVVSDGIVQLNVKIEKHGKDNIEKLLGLESEEAPAETTEEKSEKPQEKPEEQPKKESKEVKEEPKEEKAEETKEASEKTEEKGE